MKKRSITLVTLITFVYTCKQSTRLERSLPWLLGLLELFGFFRVIQVIQPLRLFGGFIWAYKYVLISLCISRVRLRFVHVMTTHIPFPLRIDPITLIALLTLILLETLRLRKNEEPMNNPIPRPLNWKITPPLTTFFPNSVTPITLITVMTLITLPATLPAKRMNPRTPTITRITLSTLSTRGSSRRTLASRLSPSCHPEARRRRKDPSCYLCRRWSRRRGARRGSKARPRPKRRRPEDRRRAREGFSAVCSWR